MFTSWITTMIMIHWNIRNCVFEICHCAVIRWIMKYTAQRFKKKTKGCSCHITHLIKWVLACGNLAAASMFSWAAWTLLAGTDFPQSGCPIVSSKDCLLISLLQPQLCVLHTSNPQPPSVLLYPDLSLWIPHVCHPFDLSLSFPKLILGGVWHIKRDLMSSWFIVPTHKSSTPVLLWDYCGCNKR